MQKFTDPVTMSCSSVLLHLIRSSVLYFLPFTFTDGEGLNQGTGLTTLFPPWPVKSFLICKIRSQQLFLSFHFINVVYKFRGILKHRSTEILVESYLKGSSSTIKFLSIHNAMNKEVMFWSWKCSTYQKTASWISMS